MKLEKIQILTAMAGRYRGTNFRIIGSKIIRESEKKISEKKIYSKK